MRVLASRNLLYAESFKVGLQLLNLTKIPLYPPVSVGL